MKIIVEWVIAFYIFICVALMVFNIAYIMKQKASEKQNQRRIAYWEKVLDQRKDGSLSNKEGKKLRQINELTSFYHALDTEVLCIDQGQSFYLHNAALIRELAIEYQKHSPMEKAFFAYFLASFSFKGAKDTEILNQIMLNYFDNSTVYCRENVLHALYSLGSVSAIEHAFSLLNENDWYHNPKLLADGLALFRGDKTALVLHLWRHRDKWRDDLLQGLVQFAGQLDDKEIQEQFYEAFEKESLSSEVRFALIRYFGSHETSGAKDILVSYLLSNKSDEEHYAISAASALAIYPGEDVTDALISGLYSRSWYIRRNAAVSLYKRKAMEKAYRMVQIHEDRYAKDMLDYVNSSMGGGK